MNKPRLSQSWTCSLGGRAASGPTRADAYENWSQRAPSRVRDQPVSFAKRKAWSSEDLLRVTFKKHSEQLSFEALGRVYGVSTREARAVYEEACRMSGARVQP